MKQINVTRSSMPDFSEYCEEIKDLWETHWLTNMGIKHKLLQKQLATYLGVSHVSLFTNGHLALEAIWESLDFPRGSEVITTPFTFCSTVHAFVRKGLTPVFCDIELESYCIDTSKIESLITKKTVAICPVHVYGNICNVEEIQKIADKYHLKVIYDAAHAFGVRYKGISAACFGDISMFSFHATKVFNTIEGGCACFSDKTYEDKLSLTKNFGISNEESVNYVGGNGKMNEFQAAMGICNLRHLEEEINKRKLVVKRYKERLEQIAGIIFCKPQKDVSPNYAYLPVIFDGFKKNRNIIFEELKAHNIIARKYFYPLVNKMDCYRNINGIESQETPIAEYVANNILTLPLYSDLSLEDVDMICDIILK